MTPETNPQPPFPRHQAARLAAGHPVAAEHSLSGRGRDLPAREPIPPSIPASLTVQL